MNYSLLVTLKSSDNEYLKYPCKGMLELFEIGTSGRLITGVFRSVLPDGSIAAPVRVKNVTFEYGI